MFATVEGVRVRVVMQSDDEISLQIPKSLAGSRVDRALADLMPDQSRSTIRRWILDGRVRLDGEQPAPRRIVQGGEAVRIDVPEAPIISFDAEPMDLDIVFEDESIIVIDKPAGLVVHPGAGNHAGTLANGLLAYDATLERLPRAGLVHRLDKNTTGLMVVARTEAARLKLTESLAARDIDRHYVAIVDGVVISGGRIDQPIGRDSRDRTKMSVRQDGRNAVTHYRVAERFNEHTLVAIKLESGRTHQIRVHMKWIRFPVTGDPVYGGRLRQPKGGDTALSERLKNFDRQALHATSLKFKHPISSADLAFDSPLPPDMEALMEALRLQRDGNGDVCP